MDESGKASEQSSITDPNVLVRGSGAGFSQEIIAGSHRLTADEPVAAGGTDIGPTPYDLLLAALGACTSMTVGMYARRKKWPLAGIVVRLRHSKIGSAQQSVRVRILRGFLESDEFGLSGSQALRLQQQIVHVSITAAAAEQSFDVAVDGFHHTH